MLIRTFILLICCFPIWSYATELAYYTARHDQRLCPAPLCGGFFVQEVNKILTRCPDNHFRRECYVTGIDWSELQLTGEQSSAIQAGRTLLHGELIEEQQGEIGKFGVLVVKEAWEAATDAPPSGAFYQVALNGIVCITDPCPSMTAVKLNTSIERTLTGLDLTQVGASEQKLEAANAQLATGLPVAGYHKTTLSPGRTRSQTLVASQFYLPFTADSSEPVDPTKQCYVGGCSGQVCSDRPDVITTCEWKEEYACYRTATCERQPDGNCGWTPTSELNACLQQSGGSTGTIDFPFGGFNFGHK